MPVDHFLKGYLRKLITILAPLESADRALEELVQREKHDPHFNRSIEFHEVISHILSKLSPDEVIQVRSIVDQLLRYSDHSTVARYLSLVNDLNHTSQNTSTPKTRDRVSSIIGADNISVYGRTIDSFENVNFDQFSDRRSIYSAANYRHSSTNQTLHEILTPYFENQIPESDLLKYIPYALAGTHSDLFNLSPKAIKLPPRISNGTSGLLHQILENGLLYQYLSQETKDQRHKNGTRMAVLSFIQEELANYLRFINLLSNQNDSSLALLNAELLHELTKLRFLYFIEKNTAEKKGPEILSFLYSYISHGDETIRELAIASYIYSSAPFTEFISRWIVDADIPINSDDFFIQKVSLNDYTGQYDFYLIPDNIPSFFKKDLALKIFNIGKTLHFLKFSCKEIRWCNSFSEKAKSLLKMTKVIETDPIIWKKHELNNRITNLYSEILNYFTFIIYGKFSLYENLIALNDYLLMAKGDFIQSVIDNGRGVLNELSNSLSGHQLTNLLKDSVLRTTSRYSENKILDNLDARLLAIGHGNLGWDVFTLDYRIEPPLELLLNNKDKDQKKDYLRVFNHLWKVKRLNYLFCDIWTNNKHLRNSNDKKLKRLFLIQNFIHGTIKRLEGFILNQIINVKHEEFISKITSDDLSAFQVDLDPSSGLKLLKGILKPSQDYLNNMSDAVINFQRFDHQYNEYPLDDLKALHSEFLSSIIKHKLINGTLPSNKGKISNKHYVTQLSNLINLSFRFGLAMRELCALKRENEGTDSVYQRETTIYKNLLSLFHDFNGDLKMFVSDLSNDDDLELRYLGVSLNQ